MRDILLRSNHRNGLETKQFERLKAGEYFVIGDNQSVSIDSRNDLGPILREHIIGIVVPEPNDPL